MSVVFDGYPPNISKTRYTYPDIDVVFSKSLTADDKIKAMLEKAVNPRVVVVVSDDRQIKFFASSTGARATGIEEFINSAIPDTTALDRKGKFKTPKSESLKPELTYVQINKINKELRNLWLK